MFNARPYSYTAHQKDHALRSRSRGAPGIGAVFDPQITTGPPTPGNEYIPAQPSIVSTIDGGGMIQGSDLGFTDGLTQWSDPISAFSMLADAFSQSFSFGLGLWSPILTGVALFLGKSKR